MCLLYVRQLSQFQSSPLLFSLFVPGEIRLLLGGGRTTAGGVYCTCTISQRASVTLIGTGYPSAGQLGHGLAEVAGRKLGNQYVLETRKRPFRLLPVRIRTCRCSFASLVKLEKERKIT